MPSNAPPRGKGLRSRQCMWRKPAHPISSSAECRRGRIRSSEPYAEIFGQNRKSPREHSVFSGLVSDHCGLNRSKGVHGAHHPKPKVPRLKRAPTTGSLRDAHGYGRGKHRFDDEGGSIATVFARRGRLISHRLTVVFCPVTVGTSTRCEQGRAKV